eukprot:TRINITY_DN15769_c0_g1_i2.p1 TRINITY_DN15769_c0_g1~~TRINITY_DN15769_c0_g1_i2.p1  ORF type:complete len:778 (-),score=98.38 TRINITY_DN15769_c0_g1_i2:7-2340(-)
MTSTELIGEIVFLQCESLLAELEGLSNLPGGVTEANAREVRQRLNYLRSEWAGLLPELRSYHWPAELLDALVQNVASAIAAAELALRDPEITLGRATLLHDAQEARSELASLVHEDALGLQCRLLSDFGRPTRPGEKAPPHLQLPALVSLQAELAELTAVAGDPADDDGHTALPTPESVKEMQQRTVQLERRQKGSLDASQAAAAAYARIAATRQSHAIPEGGSKPEQQRQEQWWEGRMYAQGGAPFRKLRQRLAAFRKLAGIEFVFIPAGNYVVGAPSGLRLAQLPLGGSNDLSERLDCRTQPWLASTASSLSGDGMSYTGGKDHHVTHAFETTVEIGACYMTRTPLTVAQWNKLKAHSAELRLSLDGILTAEDEALCDHNLNPYFVNGSHFGETRDPKIRATPADDKEAFLELPYWRARRVAAAISGSCRIPTWAEWEAASRGFEAHLLPWGADEWNLETIEFESCDWEGVYVDEGTRLVCGASTRIVDFAKDSDVAKLASPFGVSGLARCGTEWNTVACDLPGGVPSVADCAYPPRTHVIRSLSDHGTQLFLRPATQLSANHRGFVAPVLPSMSLPNRLIRTCSFRLIFPISAAETECSEPPAASYDELAELLGHSTNDIVPAFGDVEELRVAPNGAKEWCFFSQGILIRSDTSSKVVAEIVLWTFDSPEAKVPEEWNRYPNAIDGAKPNSRQILTAADLTAAWGEPKRSWTGAYQFEREHVPRIPPKRTLSLTAYFEASVARRPNTAGGRHVHALADPQSQTIGRVVLAVRHT